MTTQTTFTADEHKDISEKGFVQRMLCLPLGLVGLYALAYEFPFQWPADHWGVAWAWQAFWTVFTGYFLFGWTSCFHETAHQTLSGSKRFDILLGRFIGTGLWTPYTIYRESHIRHHAYLNRPNDWELWPYSDPTQSLAFRRVFVWFDLLLGFVTAPYTYARIFFHKNTPITNPKMRRTVWMEYAVMVTFWAAMFAHFTSTGQLAKFGLVWFLPHWFAGILQNGRKLTEHLGMASFDPMLGTRTVLSDNWLTRFGSFVNFDIFIHGPHHRHPRIAHTKLGEKMHEYEAAHPDVHYPVFQSYTAATLDMLPNLVLRPGVGLNAGAAVASTVKAEDVQDFMQDAKSIVDGGWDKVEQLVRESEEVTDETPAANKPISVG